MSTDSSSDFAQRPSDSSPFGEPEVPEKAKSPFAEPVITDPEAKAAAAAASVRSSMLADEGDFAGETVEPKASSEEPFGELPEIEIPSKPAPDPQPEVTPQIPARSPQPPPLPRTEAGEIPQLVLKAIFGVSTEMDQHEILRRARTLPQIKSVNILGAAESEAIGVLQRSLQGFGFGSDEPLTLRVGASDIDFIKGPEVTLAVLTEGGYAAGIRETLIIVARELSRLA